MRQWKNGRKRAVISQTVRILLEAPLRRFQRCAGVRFSLRKWLEAATYDSIFSRGAPLFLGGGSTPRPRCCDSLEKVDVVGANGREAGRSLVMCGVGYLSSGNLSRKIGVSGRKIAAER